MMKYDIVLNDKKYVVEIDDAKVKLLTREDINNSNAANDEDTDDMKYYDVPDFDFEDSGEEKKSIDAQLPGTVIAIKVKKGDTVTKGQVLLVMESMKMENEIISDGDYLIDDILVDVGMNVSKNRKLLLMETAEK